MDILPYILAVPLGIAANLLTPRVQRWWATTSEARRQETDCKAPGGVKEAHRQF